MMDDKQTPVDPDQLPDYSQWSTDELRDAAQSHGYAAWATASREQLIEILTQSQGK